MQTYKNYNYPTETNWSEDKQDLEYLLDHFARKIRYQTTRTSNYVNKLNEYLDRLNSTTPDKLSLVPSHKFYITIRNIIRDILLEWHSSYKLTEEETFFLRNSVLFLNRLVNIIEDTTKLSSWLPDISLINAFAECLSDIDRLLSFDKEKFNFKQLSHLLEVFNTYYERLPVKLENHSRLLEAMMDCIVSSNYDAAFRRLKPNAKSMTTKEKFFLIQCPSFLTNYHGSPSQKIIGQILDTMIPRYASLLSKHTQSLNQWKSPIMHAVHHLLLTVIHANGHYTLYANGQPIQWLIDNLILILREKSIIKKINDKPLTPETLLIDSILRLLVGFVHEPDLLVYIKQLKITPIFQSLVSVAYESIVIHAYVMLSYTLEEDDIIASEKDSGRLLSNIFDTLRKKTKKLSRRTSNQEANERYISLLAEAVQVLVQHDQIKSEILKQNALSLLINSCTHFNNRSKRLLLESLGSITFDQEAASVLREDTQFINSMQDMQKTTDDGINKAAEKIVWNLFHKGVKEAPRKDPKLIQSSTTKKQEVEEEEDKSKEEYQHDIMISYCHADKEIVYRIHKYLSDHGFKVWLDRDNIYGPAMQAMAGAVENAEFVIICMSDSYKRSVYCQAEAEYAFRCKRRLLPVIVRQGYRPDGWLGLLIGSRIYIDFGRIEYKTACELLLKEIMLQRESRSNDEINVDQIISDDIKSIRQSMIHDTDPSIPIDTENMEQGTLPENYMNRNTKKSAYRSISIEQWTKKDVLDFLYDTNLHHMMPLCEVMTGQGLIKLFHICQTKPSRLHGQLNDELMSRFRGLHLPIGIFTQFLSEIEQLMNSSSSASPTLQEKPESKSSLSSQSSAPSPVNTTNSTKITKSSAFLVVPNQAPVQQNSTLTSQSPTSPTVTTIEKSRNVQITEQTAVRKQSMDGGSMNYVVRSSQKATSVQSEQINPYQLEQTHQNQQINALPYLPMSAQQAIYP